PRPRLVPRARQRSRVTRANRHRLPRAHPTALKPTALRAPASPAQSCLGEQEERALRRATTAERGAKPPFGSTKRFPQLARERVDRSAGAAGELELPLALGLEAAIAQPLAPRLDRLADGIEIVGVAAQLAGASHHVGRGADEGAQCGARLDRVLPAGPGAGERRGQRLDVIEEEALGVLAHF